MRRNVVIGSLVVVVFVQLVFVAVDAAGAAGTNITLTNDVKTPDWNVGPCGQISCTHQVFFTVGPKQTYSLYKSLDLPDVQHLGLTDRYYNNEHGRLLSYEYNYSIDVDSGGSASTTLTLTELHKKTYSSRFKVSVTCNEIEGSIQHTNISCG